MLNLSGIQSFGQDCTDFHKYQCTFADYTFFLSRQSKSFPSAKGQTTKLQVIAYEGETYFMSVCTNKKFGVLHFRILEDDADKTVLFDNADNGYNESVIFTNEVTKNLIYDTRLEFLAIDERHRTIINKTVDYYLNKR